MAGQQWRIRVPDSNEWWSQEGATLAQNMKIGDQKVKTLSIPLDQIEQSENSRVVYKKADLSELMSSMHKDGLLQPVGVRKLPSGMYDAVFGNRRIIAAKHLDWSEIPAVIVEAETDVDRDILGLVENFKRQNTSVAEDGRMFKLLINRGLNAKEIAARLDVTVQRIHTALEIIDILTPEMQKKVHYRAPGTPSNKLADRVSATAAVAILNMRKTAGLSRAQTREVFTYASRSTPSNAQIAKIGPLVKSGVSIEDAIEQVAHLERFAITVYIPEKTCRSLIKKHDKPVHEVLTDFLVSNAEFNIQPMLRGQKTGSHFRVDTRRKDRMMKQSGDEATL